MKRLFYLFTATLAFLTFLSATDSLLRSSPYPFTDPYIATLFKPIDQCFEGTVHYCIADRDHDGKIQLPEQTDYWTGTSAIDDQGLPFRQGKHGRYYNASSIAFTIYTPRLFDIRQACSEFSETPSARAAVQWIIDHQVALPDGAITWHYNYDTPVNDVLLKAPFASAFSQAAMVERLLLLSCVRNDPSFLDLAKRAARAFSIPVTAGGLRSEDPAFVWFQELPLPDRHNPYILNAHLYAIYALNLAHNYFPEEGFDQLASRGIEALMKALPTVDSGHWTRYDLRPAYPAYHLAVGRTDAVLKSLSVQIGGRTSEIDFHRGRINPLGNVFSGRHLNPVPDGGTGLPEGMIFNFILPAGREFHWSLLETPMMVTARIACCDRAFDLSTIARTPSASQQVRLPLKSRFREGQDEVLIFESGLHDANWGTPGPEYQPYHAELIAHLYRQTGRKELYLYALRWQGFIRSYEKRSQLASAGQQPYVFDRIPFHADDRLKDGLAQMLNGRLPEEIDETELKAVLEAIYPSTLHESNALKKAAWRTLGYGMN